MFPNVSNKKIIYPLFIRVFFFLILINVHFGNLFYCGDQTAKFISFVLSITLFISFLYEDFSKAFFSKEKIFILIPAIFFFIFVFVISPKSNLIGLVTVLGALLFVRSDEIKKAQIYSFITTIGLMALFYCYYNFSSRIWYCTKSVNHLFMKIIEFLTRSPMPFGHHSSGFLILLTFFFFSLSLIVHTKISKHNIILFFVLSFSYSIIQILYLFLHQILFYRIQLNIYHNRFGLTPFGTHWILFLLLSLLLFYYYKNWYYCKNNYQESHQQQKRKETSKGGKKIFFPIAGYIVIFFFLTLFFILSQGKNSSAVSSSERNKAIFIYDNVDWSRPVFGAYGEKSGGMFGNLPRFLRSLDFKVFIEKTINQQTLQKASTLVLINLAEKFNKEVKNSIQDFVREGGSLLVLGDHTGYGFIREPFNDLLEPMNISFRFDSARSLVPSWQNCMEIRLHDATRRVKSEKDIQIWTGASLETHYPAAPIIIGKRAFSDAGDRKNVAEGYLGNFIYERSEFLGDIVLAAEAKLGKGKVMVFGDTSSFQNGALPYSYQFVNDIFQWLSRKENSLMAGGGKFFPLFFLILFFFFLGLLWFFSPCLSVFFLLLSIFFYQGGHLFPFFKPSILRIERKKHNPVAYIDSSHGELFSLTGWQKNSIDGLLYNLMRNNFTPLVTEQISHSLLEEADLLIFLAPTSTFSLEEKELLQQFLCKGGFILWAANYPIKKASASFLADMGLHFRNIPRGPVKGDVFHQEIQFQDAWPISISQKAKEKTEVLFEKKGYPLIVFQKIGKGGLLLISDARFLLNENLEHIDFFHLGNIHLFRELMGKIIL